MYPLTRMEEFQITLCLFPFPLTIAFVSVWRVQSYYILFHLPNIWTLFNNKVITFCFTYYIRDFERFYYVYLHLFTFCAGGALRTLLILRVPYICKKNDGCMTYTEDRRQRTEDRRQRTEDRRQRTEDRGQKTEGHGIYAKAHKRDQTPHPNSEAQGLIR